MSKTPPEKPSAGAARAPAPDGDKTPVLTGEEKFQLFWEKNSRTIYIVCIIIVLVVAGKYSVDYFRAQHQRGVQAAFAAATTPEQLRAFAREHAANSLGGLARLELADQDYAAGRYADAAKGYADAAKTLAGSALIGRARLGLAVSQLLSGDKTAGVSGLQAVAGDPALLQTVRSEAAYHLASLALDEGKSADAKGYIDQIMQIAPDSPWAQRALALQSSLAPAAPASPMKSEAPAAHGAAPAIKFNAPGS